MTADNSSQQARIEQVCELTAARLDELQQTVDLARGERRQDVLDIMASHRGRDLIDRIRQLVQTPWPRRNVPPVQPQNYSWDIAARTVEAASADRRDVGERPSDDLVSSHQQRGESSVVGGSTRREIWEPVDLSSSRGFAPVALLYERSKSSATGGQGCPEESGRFSNEIAVAMPPGSTT